MIIKQSHRTRDRRRLDVVDRDNERARRRLTVGSRKLERVRRRANGKRRTARQTSGLRRCYTATVGRAGWSRVRDDCTTYAGIV